jgi:hypothetical protein
VFPDAKKIRADLIGEYALGDDVSKYGGVRQRLPLGPAVMSPNVSNPISKKIPFLAMIAD